MWKLLFYVVKILVKLKLNIYLVTETISGMLNTELPEIELTGEKLVELWLSGNGYTNIYKENLQIREIVIIATGTLETILVRVRTFVHPQRPYKLSEYDIDKITRRASKLNQIAYAAYVVIDEYKNLVGDINWERLG